MLVTHLKDEIMRANPQTFALATVQEATLTLYKINVKVDISDHGQYKKILEEISRPDFVFTPKELLHGTKPLEAVFGSSGPTEGRIHILAVPPPGEPINKFQGVWLTCCP